MNLLSTVKSLYALNGIAAMLLYLPQIFRAWKDREHALSISLLSFGGWTVGSLVTVLYAWLFIKDGMFTMVSIGNTVGSASVFIIAAHSRLKPCGKPLSPLAARDEADDVAGLAEQLP